MTSFFTLVEGDDHVGVCSNSGSKHLVLSRFDGTIKVTDQRPSGRETKILFVLGVFSLPTLHLAVVTEARAGCEVDGVVTLRVATGVHLVPVETKRRGYDPALEAEYRSLLETVFASEGLLFDARGGDPTHCVQRRGQHAPDLRFHWNRAATQPLVAAGAAHLVQPCAYGFCASRRVGGTTLAVISRRSCLRTGRRYTVRGLDESGNAANFVETEMVVSDGRTVSSLVQVRGSIPLLWTQKVNFKYTPKIALDPSPARQAAAFGSHFAELFRIYGRQTCVSLINLKGVEKTMADAYSAEMARFGSPNARLIAFDFHKECAKMRYDRLSVLMADLKPDLATHGHFEAQVGSLDKPDRVQGGTVRTNCIDCLDRTNVVQSVIARAFVAERLGQPGAAQLSPPELEAAFKVLWAENGDGVSRQYSGTGAMKADFTRTGKRTMMGALEDGQKSLTRYFLNNLHDGHAHDALELFVGAYLPAFGVDPFVERRSAKFKVNLAFTFAFLFLGLAALALYGIEGTVNKAAWVVFWATCFVIVLQGIKVNGFSLVDKPVLHLLKPGPGHHTQVGNKKTV
jgi:hypothetical protein